MADPWFLRAARAAGQVAGAWREGLASASPTPSDAPRFAPVVANPPPNDAPEEYDAPLAPWPLIDRYPVIHGSSLSMATIASVSRLALTGYRHQFVDMLDELLERDTHAYAVTAKRVFAVAGARVAITPCNLPESDGRKQKAGEIAEFCERVWLGLPDIATTLACLNWGVFHGAGADETSWGRDSNRTVPKRLHFIHSRRINWPDPSDWTAHIWDQGSVGWGLGYEPTTQAGAQFGLRVSDYPAQFVVHTPRLRGDYPVREGVGRILAPWMGMKLLAARVGSQYIERFARPWPIWSYTTGADGKPRVAGNPDIQAANSANAALGTGSLAGAVLPDTIKLDLMGPGVQGRGLTNPETWLQLINNEESKAVLGSTLGTETGQFGSRSNGETHERATAGLLRYDAQVLADTLKRDVFYWLVWLNFPEDIALVPEVKVVAEEKPDPETVIKVAKDFAAIGGPLSADGLGEMLGLPMTEEEKPDDAPDGWKPGNRRLAPVALVDLARIDPSVKAPPEPPPAMHPGLGPIGQRPAGDMKPNDQAELAREVQRAGKEHQDRKANGRAASTTENP